MQAFRFSAVRNKQRNKSKAAYKAPDYFRSRPARRHRMEKHMDKKMLDWKFALTSLLAIAGLVIPFYFWQADSSAHSLTVRLISSSALALPADSKIHDLQITVNGSQIESPHVYSLALINTGSKPISSADFESPLDVRTRNDAKLITAQITGSDPADIPVKILLDDNKLKVQPCLLYTSPSPRDGLLSRMPSSA